MLRVALPCTSWPPVVASIWQRFGKISLQPNCAPHVSADLLRVKRGVHSMLFGRMSRPGGHSPHCRPLIAAQSQRGFLSRPSRITRVSAARLQTRKMFLDLFTSLRYWLVMFHGAQTGTEPALGAHCRPRSKRSLWLSAILKFNTFGNLIFAQEPNSPQHEGFYVGFCDGPEVRSRPLLIRFSDAKDLTVRFGRGFAGRCVLDAALLSCLPVCRASSCAGILTRRYLAAVATSSLVISPPENPDSVLDFSRPHGRL